MKGEVGSQGEGRGLGMKRKWRVDDNTFKNVGSKGGKINEVKRTLGSPEDLSVYLFKSRNTGRLIYFLNIY